MRAFLGRGAWCSSAKAEGLLGALVAASLLLLAPDARACAPAPPAGEAVRITDEAALIVWDPKTKTEHFIRSASFATTAKDFGFLVPTPTKPALSEVSGDLLPELMRHTQPKVEHRTKGVDVIPGCAALMFLSRSKSAGMEPASAVAPVRVLEEARVAGYDAVVLEADSATALSDWLKQHGYAEGPTLTEWLAPYIAQKWKITAFKIAPSTRAQAISTSAVRMTFTTEKPFYPYREPKDQRETRPASLRDLPDERTLRVFFIGPERVDGVIGEGGPLWPGKPRWSNPYRRTTIPSKPLPFELPEDAWLTDFEDKSSPRPGTDDVFFSPAKDRSPVVPPPIYIDSPFPLFIPIELVVVLGAGGFLFFRWRRKRRAAKPQ